jgi:3-oxoacyl-[acyl-carrier protein] reductase
VVTGASSGIGRAIAIELADAGATLLLHARANSVGLEETAERCRALGAAVHTALADLAEPAERSALAGAAFARLSRLDVWVNNAGADILTGAAASLSYEEKLAKLWRVDVEATIELSRRVGARLRTSGGGAIINMGWDQAEAGMGGESGEVFAAAKGAVMSFSRSLSLSLAPQVRVNCLAPGWIRTGWGEKASESWQRRAVAEAPLGRWGTPADVAKAARFLAGPAAEFVTGQTFAVNGGAVR